MTLAQDAGVPERSLAGAPAFIEVQFPVSKLSKESYKERKAGGSQTLTALGKWWGRKPLVLVRAAILGLLLPATADPAADRTTFLALMTMDDDGMLRRLKTLPGAAAVYAHATTSERQEYFALGDGTGKHVGTTVPRWMPGISAASRQRLAKLAILRMGYDERLEYCRRPEEIDGPSPEAWAKINVHLGTRASSLPELVGELGQRRFSHLPRVADAFCGGGSIPFEAARIGCEAFGSDLNPMAALLTWGALNIVGGGPEAVAAVRAAQERVYEAARLQVEAWGIERNEDGWIADAYLYCNEVLDPATGWRVPLAPSWIIAEGPRVIGHLVPDQSRKCFEIEVHEGVTDEELKQAAREGTWQSGGVTCPVASSGTPLAPEARVVTNRSLLRGREGLRRWERDDIIPRPGDVFQERLYCIRWVDPASGERHYRAPTLADLKREDRVLELLQERLPDWQDAGYVPNMHIEPGAKTSDAIGMRGWTYWHHLFNPRQLLLAGLVASLGAKSSQDRIERVASLLASARVADWNSRCSRWHPGRDEVEQTFYNQSIAPLVNYGCRPTRMLRPAISTNLSGSTLPGLSETFLADARVLTAEGNIWITDPGYADAIHYEEISEFFLAWLEKRLPKVFPDWYADSRRALAVRGKGQTFRQAMVECYTRFVSLMPDDGFQIVMFTHTDAEVWADLALILWASGLQVSAAWTIGTETAAVGIREGRYVQGTVLLVLRKRQGAKRGDLADIYPDVQAEVQNQLDAMLQLDPKEDPNFSDADYQLAAYAAALRVLTAYERIDDIDVARELQRGSGKGERSRLTGLIERAVRIASDHLVPEGLDRAVWRQLTAEERLYCKGVEVEAHGDYREGVYQEFARGLGVSEYKHLLAGATANQTRLKTPSEFGNRDLRPREVGFAGSLLRMVLFAVATTVERHDPKPARDYLRTELPDYWDQRLTLAALLRYLASRPSVAMTRWKADAEAASDLATVLANDRV